jgi:hypothetical protein
MELAPLVEKIEEKALCHDGEFMTEESLLTFFLEMAICP